MDTHETKDQSKLSAPREHAESALGHMEVIEGRPTDEDLQTLRRVPGKIEWIVFTIVFLDLCERLTYYGTSIVMTNFIQRPLPSNSATGAGGKNGQSGALGYGQETSYALSTFKQFFFYTTPLLGAYLADARWGRFRVICMSVGLSIVAHVVFVVAALPSVIHNREASLATFILATVLLGFGTGGVKPNLSPLVAEQLSHTELTIKILPNNEKVISDPALTLNRAYMYYYFFTNVGGLIGTISMPYAEKYVGFWLAWLVPTAFYFLCPAILLWGYKRYRVTKPEPSAFGKAIRLWVYAQKDCWSFNPIKTWRSLNDGTMWYRAMPSNVAPSHRPSWMTFDDAWVEVVHRGFSACKVFAWYPLYFLCYNQINNNLTSQAALLQTHGFPNEILTSIDPLAIIILIPIFDRVLYPLLRSFKINPTPIKKITAAFFFASAAMIWAAVLQYYIYKKSPCGYSATTCESPSPISFGAQSGAFVLIAISEILGTITVLEYSFSKAPVEMRSLVQALALFANAVASAIGEALTPLTHDPLLIWNFAVPAILSAVGGLCFWFRFRKLDADEDKLNMLSAGTLNRENDEKLGAGQ
ncbi:hypothetical protein UA08_00120 [Talaromyces atroroseus]|uniref:Peptide transporter ptr2 n=1 Tax=Talaromyces atroroseus TaxID=1441469 RepID=A0A225ASM8_TALAT|nr:hypothetical protein UA08_00120 [Talaromyces atroroseus]OKL63990.1 hypothetical protein UA08_00120 [Talaromyces atroroseus]